MAPVRRVAARGSASLRPSSAAPPPPPPPPASNIERLSPHTLVELERLFLSTLPKGHLRDVTPQQRTSLMNECSDLDAALLRRWWHSRQWDEKRKPRDSPSEAGDEEEQIDSQASATSNSGKSLVLLLSPTKQRETNCFSEYEHNRLYQPSRPHSPSVSHAALAESPTADSFEPSNSPPRPRRNRLMLRMYTQPQYNPSQTPPQPPRYGGTEREEDPFASPRSRARSWKEESLLMLEEAMRQSSTTSTREGVEMNQEGLLPMWDNFERSMDRIIQGEAGLTESGGEERVFTLDDVYQLSRLGVNETEDAILFFCCQRLAIGNWVRVLDLRNPEVMFYFSPRTSCFQAWTAHDSRFYRISLPLSAITSIKIYHDVAQDEACLLITRSIFTRPSISFATSKPMTLKWEPTPHDFTVDNQATRCDTWCVAVKSADAAISAIRRIAASEFEKAGGQEEAGLAFLRKVWWGPWDSEKTTVNDLVSSLDLPLTVEPVNPLEAALQGGAPVAPSNHGEDAATTLEFQHPRLPSEHIWCSTFLQPSHQQDGNSPFPRPVAPQFSAGAEQDLRCPWLTDDLDRRLLAPWPNPLFPPPVIIEDEWTTLAKAYSPSPEKASQPALRPSLQLNTSQPAKTTAPSSSPSRIPFSATTPIPGVLDDNVFASSVVEKAPIDWSDEEARDQEYPLDWLLEGYTHFA